jgi:hypothetical protein
MKPGYTLSINDEFDLAMNNKQNVIIFKDSKIINYGGLIDDYTDKAVKIDGSWFIRKLFVFQIR